MKFVRPGFVPERVSVVGLGKLGVPLVAVLATKGFQVIGVDERSYPVEMINASVSPVEEPHVQSLIEKNHSRIRAVADISEAVRGTDVTFVVVPTPSSSTGEFSNDAVFKVARELGSALKHKSSHICVLVSTVMPGSTSLFWALSEQIRLLCQNVRTRFRGH